MRFKKIYIEITNTCNLSCPFCIQNSRKPAYMNFNQFNHILQEIKPYTHYIYLHVLGEPLMHPDLENFLQLAFDNHFHVNLTTNGTLLKNSLPVLLKAKALRQINISLHSFPQIDNYLENVFECGDILSENNVYVSYRMWTMDKNEDPNMNKTILAIQNHYNCTLVDMKNSVKLKDHCFISFDTTFEWPSLSNTFISDQGTCQGFRHMCAILVDGRVVPCCLDSKGEAVLGNIFEEPFNDILDKNQKILQDFSNHKMSLELCKKCSYRLRFDPK